MINKKDEKSRIFGIEGKISCNLLLVFTLKNQTFLFSSTWQWKSSIGHPYNACIRSTKRYPASQSGTCRTWSCWHGWWHRGAGSEWSSQPLPGTPRSWTIQQTGTKHKHREYRNCHGTLRVVFPRHCQELLARSWTIQQTGTEHKHREYRKCHA